MILTKLFENYIEDEQVSNGGYKFKSLSATLDKIRLANGGKGVRCDGGTFYWYPDDVSDEQIEELHGKTKPYTIITRNSMNGDEDDEWNQRYISESPIAVDYSTDVNLNIDDLLDAVSNAADQYKKGLNALSIVSKLKEGPTRDKHYPLIHQYVSKAQKILRRVEKKIDNYSSRLSGQQPKRDQSTKRLAQMFSKD